VFAGMRVFILFREWNWTTHLLVFCIQLSFFIGVWHFMKMLNDFLEKHIPYERGISKRILVQILISLLVLTPFIALFIFLTTFLVPALITKSFIAVVSMFTVVMIFLLNIGYGAAYFFRQWRISIQEKAALEVRAAQTEKDKSMMKYHHLKNQVNPHFLFNTFTSLDGLIQTDPKLASEFVRHLSKVYRYVLEHKENEVVSMETEINFIEHYISILKTRYKEALEVNINLSEDSKEKGIVMVTLQMLIDNAIKHNIVQNSAPLRINIWDNNSNLHVQNNKQLRKQIETSNGQGLIQLQELYSFITDKKITINNTKEIFEINLPLLGNES
jgi:sensor histidine kinase YesM